MFGNRTEAQEAEKLSPLKEQSSIPLYSRVMWQKRTCGNKCLYSIYRIFRMLFVSVWFYYAPFIALLLNFMAPVLFVEKKELSIDGSSMG